MRLSAHRQARAAGAGVMPALRPSAVRRLLRPCSATAASPVTAAFEVKPDAAPLFAPLQLGAVELQHRVVMAPLTRCRAPGNVCPPIMAEYYGQRASPGGLIISEATAICPEAHGYPQVPGIYTPEQTDSWRPVVQAVHAKGGRFFMQLWHVGRASHPLYQPGGAAPVSASALAIPEADGFEVYGPAGEGPFPYPTPRALEASELPGIVAAYVAAAKNAIAAGCDGVEIHAANGYLLDQFWKDFSNTRTDDYGGSTEAKGRLLLEVTEAVAGAVGAERVGIRLSPYNVFLSACDRSSQDSIDKNVWLLRQLEARLPRLAYVHLIEPRAAAGNADIDEATITTSLKPFREATHLKLLAAGGYKRPQAIQAVQAGRADAVVFGRLFISNPDLPKRLAVDAPLNAYDRESFYTWGPEGYTDYPSLEQQQQQQD